MLKPTLLILSSLIISACSSTGIDRDNKNTTIQISYAKITSVQEVELKSDVGKSSAIGGLWGLAAASGGDRNDMAAGAAAGALLMGLTTKIVEGSNKAWSYQLRQSNGSEFKVISDDSHLHVGDCAAIERGNTTNLRRVAPEMCAGSLSAGAQSVASNSHQQDATECHQAKQELLAAETSEQLDHAKQKVEVLCH